MCDYSLMHLPNRLAREGEALVVHCFPSGSKGLASPADLEPNADLPANKQHSFWTALKDFLNSVPACPVPAVCIPPGARLRLHEIDAGFQSEYRLQSDEDVTFEQLSEAVYTYRDAVCFRSGLRVRLQELTTGQRVTVLSLAQYQNIAQTQGELESAPPVRLQGGH